VAQPEATIKTGRRIYYGWWIVLGAFLVNAVGGGVSFWSFGIYIEPLEREFGWSRAEVSGAISLGFLAAGITGPLAGRLVDRRGARIGIFAGAVIGAICYFLLTGIGALWHYYALQFVAAACRTFTNYIPINSLITRWFSLRRATALGLSSAGFIFGGVIFVPLLSAWVEQQGWRSGLALSGALLLLAYIPFSVLLVRNRPEDVGASLDGLAPAAHTAGAPAELPGLPYSVAVRRPAFWLISTAFALFFMAYGSFQVHAVPFFHSEGLSVTQAGLVVASSAGIVTLLRLPLGFFLDRVRNTRPVTIVSCVIQAAALLLIVVSTETPAIVAFVLLWSVGGCFGPLMESLMLTERFGMRSFGALLGTMGVVEMFGFLFGPWVGGWLYDRSGNYDTALLLYAGAIVAAVAIFLILPVFEEHRTRLADAPA
jgi:MFS family permease